MSKEQDIRLNKGDRVHVRTPGGGGFGNPYERNPELVLKDVLEQKCTIKQAREIYSVIIDQKKLKIDWEKL